MDINVSYSTEEVAALLIAHHRATFGDPPVGERWVCDNGFSYKDWTVENEPVVIAEPTPADPTPDAGTVAGTPEAEPNGVQK